MADLGKGTYTLEVDAKGFNTNIGGAKTKALNFGKLLKGGAILGSIAAVGAGLAAAGKAAATFAADSLKLAGDFEASLAQMRGLVGIPQEVLDAWSPAIRQLSSEVGKAPQELADAMFFITSAGLRGQNALDALTVSAKAAAAGLGETQSIADAVTSAMNAYGPAVLSAEAATDVLTATVREGKLEAASLATQIGDVIPVANNLGVSFQEVGALMAALSRTGTNAPKAATQIAAAMRSLIRPTGDAAKQLEKYIGGAQEMRDLVDNEGFLNAVVKLKTNIQAVAAEKQAAVDALKATGATAEAIAAAEDQLIDVNEVLGNIFNDSKGLLGVFDLTGESLETNLGIVQKLETAAGDTAAAFEAVQGTLNFEQDRLQASLDALKTAFGSKFTEAGAGFLGPIADAFDKIRTMIENIPEEKLEGIVAFFTQFGENIADFITTHAQGLLNILNWLGEKQLENERREEERAARRQAQEEAWNEFVEVANAAVAVWVEDFNRWLEKLTEFFTETLPEWFEDFMESLDEFIKSVIDWFKNIQEHWDNAKQAITTAFETVKEAVKLFVNNLKEQIEVRFKGIIDKFKQFITDLINKVEEFKNKIIEVFNAIVAKAKAAINTVIGFINRIKNKIPGVKRAPDIPELAAGGIVSKPTIALIGEAGPEAVVPLDRQFGNIGTGGPTNIWNVNLYGGGSWREFVETVTKEQQRQAQYA